MDQVKQTNQDLLKRHHPGLSILLRSREEEKNLTIIKTKSGPNTILVRRNGKQISLHSRFDPLKEGRDLAAGLDIEAGDILIVLGLGLGYHLIQALDDLDPDIPVILIEASASIFYTALNHTDFKGVLDRPSFYPIIGLSGSEALKAASRIQVKHGFARPRILEHPASVRLDPDYYSPLIQRLNNAAAADLRNRFIRPRLQQEQLNILLLDSGYYLLREITDSASLLGHRVERVVLPDRNYGSEESLRDFLKVVAEFRPDFVLSINHLGLDTRGVLAGLLSSMNLPLASWFVDSPTLVLGSAADPGTDSCSIFLWDRDYVEDVKALGFDKVHYLPLGTDDNIFRPGNPKGEWACQVGFVGDSMVRPVKKYIDRLDFPREYLPLVKKAALLFIGVPDRSPGRVMEQAGLISEEALAAMQPEKRIDLEGLVTWWATMIYRQGIVKKMAPFHPTVVGDDGWTMVFGPDGFTLRPEMDYYHELPNFYPVCRINLNATSMQMKTGLNQRIFDIPAAGSFVLTDYRRQLEDLFEPQTEMVCYRDPEEAIDLARYYLKHETERRALAEKARRRVLAEHTYRHRLASLIETMRQDYLS